MSLSLTEWLELLESRHPWSIDLGLDRVHEVWQRMGSPRPASQIFTVAGTNGKGSTVAYLCGMLDELGYRYGSYTTPHLLHYNERVQLNGVTCADYQLVAAFERIEAARGEISLSYFEFGTLAAISIMSGKSLDYAVMEVGLGGRLDAVNLLDTDCAVITPIGLDHQEYLGPDRETIGREKAGIIRRGAVLVCAEEDPPDSLLAVAASLQVAPLRQGREFVARRLGDSIHFSQAGLDWMLPLPAMAGEHQVGNMATAVAALLELVPQARSLPDLIARGLKSVRIAGRLQKLSTVPLVLVDAGHNPMAARAVSNTLEEMLKDSPGRRCLCVLGMLADKDATAVAEILNPLVSDWYCAGLVGQRGQTGAELAAKISHVVSGATVTACENVDSALSRALGECSETDCLLVFGSFLTAASAIGWWKSNAVMG